MLNNRIIPNRVESGDIEIMTNREWLSTLTDEEFAEQVMDVARVCLFDFTKKNFKVTTKDQERSFAKWLKAQKICYVERKGGDTNK